MRNLVLIFLRFGHIFLFIFLEFVCLYLIVSYNRKQKAIWDNSTNIFLGNSSEKWNDWSNYLNLRENADKLAAENAKLKEKLINFGLKPTIEVDSIFNGEQRYAVIPAKVINTSTSQPNNYVMLDKGKKDGIRAGMAVISDDGIVGIIRSVSNDFARATSILHRRSSISASIKRTAAFGSLRWTKNNPRYVNLEGIEKHQIVKEKDTIVTSAFSAHFPPGILIGTVEKTELPKGSNFHTIDVLLNNDFSSLNYVYIIDNFKQAQQQELEGGSINE